MNPKPWLLVMAALAAVGCGAPSPEKVCGRAAELSQDVSETECQASLEQEQKWDPVVYKKHVKCILAATSEPAVAVCLPPKPKQSDSGTVASSRAPQAESGLEAGAAQSPGARSCEEAHGAYLRAHPTPDPSASTAHDPQLQSILNKGTYLDACRVPGTTAVDICAAIQDGAAIGVTVRVTPPNEGIAACIDGKVRAMRFPPDPSMSIAHTKFVAQ